MVSSPTSLRSTRRRRHSQRSRRVQHLQFLQRCLVDARRDARRHTEVLSQPQGNVCTDRPLLAYDLVNAREMQRRSAKLSRVQRLDNDAAQKLKTRNPGTPRCGSGRIPQLCLENKQHGPFWVAALLRRNSKPPREPRWAPLPIPARQSAAFCQFRSRCGEA